MGTGEQQIQVAWPDQALTRSNSISDAYPILSALAVMDVYQVAFMAGVWNNMLFDPPVLQRAVVSNVSAVKFEVDCQALPNAAQSGTINVNRSANSILYPFHIDDSLEDVEFSLSQSLCCSRSYSY